MDKFEVLTERYGLKPQGKSAPMAASRTPQNQKISSSFDYPRISTRSSSLDPSFYKAQQDFQFGEKTDPKIDDDIFGLTFKLSKSSERIGGNSSFDFDFMFGGPGHSQSPVEPLHEESRLDPVAEGDILGFGTSQKEPGVHVVNLLGDFGDMDLGRGDLKGQNCGEGMVIEESVSDDLILGFGGCFHHRHSDIGADIISGNAKQKDVLLNKREEDRHVYHIHRNRQSDDENDIGLFFSEGNGRSDAGTKAHDFNLDTFFESKGGSRVKSTSSGGGVPVSVNKEHSTPDIHGFSFMFDDLKACGDFNEIDGESEERRAARWKRHQDTIQRMAKAVSDMNRRDLETLHQQEEREKIAEIVNNEMKQWAAGKEGNLRALLSTLHKVLWAECGWQPVPLTDLITSTSVKRVYKRAALCVHPDKVQQKGATSRQKYVAEKAFDVLKEAWNKFNTEELH